MFILLIKILYLVVHLIITNSDLYWCDFTATIKINIHVLCDVRSYHSMTLNVTYL